MTKDAEEKHKQIMNEADELARRLACWNYGKTFDTLSRDIQLIVFNAARKIIENSGEK